MEEPVYISMEGLLDSSSESEEEEEIEKKPEKKYVPRKSKLQSFKNNEFEGDSSGENNVAPAVTSNAAGEKNDDKVVALSKKQLNRLAAMDIYPIPSGGIGTVNASLFNPVTIKWLMKNFETVDGNSLPRYLVYNHYLLHCKSLNIKPINAASFGKVIRSVFLGLQTRRLGTRGNSKYHYCGMRIKPDSPLLHVIINDSDIRKSKSVSFARSNEGLSNNGNKFKRTIWTSKTFEAWKKKFCDGIPVSYLESRRNQSELQQIVKPNTEFITDGLNTDDASVFKIYYQSHSNSILSAVFDFRLEKVGLQWQKFYQLEKNSKIALNPQEYDANTEMGHSFHRSKLRKLIANRSIQSFMNEIDKQTYNNMAHLLCSKVTVTVPLEVNQVIRNFLGTVEDWLLDALDCYPDEFKAQKLKTLQNVLRPLEQAINTNSLYCSTERKLKQKQKLDCLLRALNEIDFRHLNKRINWINDGLVVSVGEKIKDVLAKPDRLKLLVSLIEEIVEKSLTSTQPVNEFKMMLQNVFLGLSCYMSHVKSELLFICRDSMEIFNCIESFMLEYLKYFMHLRTGVRALAAAASSCVGCTEEDDGNLLLPQNVVLDENLQEIQPDETVVMEREDSKAGLVSVVILSNDEDETTQDQFQNDDELNIELEETRSRTCVHPDFTDAFVADEKNDVLQFLSSLSLEKPSRSEEESTQLILGDFDMLELETFDVDDSFRKYFSSSGYVTNYFCQGLTVLGNSDTDSNEDDDETDPFGFGRNES